MRIALILGLIWFPAGALADSAGQLQALNSESYQLRQLAQVKLADWLKRHPEKASKALIAYYKKEASPEVRNRIHLLLQQARWLRTRVLAEKYGAPKGFVGIHMTDAKVLIDEKAYGAVQVNSIFPGSPADTHGLQVGDRIWKVDGKEFAKKVGTNAEFKQRVTSKHAGDKLTLDLMREGELQRVTLFLAARDIEIQRQSGSFQERRLAEEKELHYEQWLNRQLGIE